MDTFWLNVSLPLRNSSDTSTDIDDDDEEEDEADAPNQVANTLAFDLMIFNKKTNTMAMLGSGLADRHPNVASYGPSYGHPEEFRFFGEGAEFLRAVVSPGQHLSLVP